MGRFKKLFGSRRRRVVLGAVVTLVVIGTISLVYASWATNGSGSGYAKASSAQTLTTVDVSASTSASLYPGADGNLLLKIHNANPYPVKVTALAGNGTITADSGHASCVTTGVTFTNQTGLNITIAANSDTQTTLSNAVHMSNASDNGCQGATFTIPLALTGASDAP